MNSKDLSEDPHLNARGFFARLPHAEVEMQTHIGIRGGSPPRQTASVPPLHSWARILSM